MSPALHHLHDGAAGKSAEIEQRAAGLVDHRHSSAIEAHARTGTSRRNVADGKERPFRHRRIAGGDEADVQRRRIRRQLIGNLSHQAEHLLRLIGGGSRQQHVDAVHKVRGEIGKVV